MKLVTKSAFSRLSFGIAVSAALIVCVPAHATPSFVITPTFASNITSDPNAAAIEGEINNAIVTYENTFSNPITVTIEFQEMSGGLGSSEKDLFGIAYSGGGGFYDAYVANALANNDPAANTALVSGVVPNQIDNPVTGTVDMGIATADIRALGIPCGGCTGPSGFDGIIGLNTSITTPGSPASSLEFNLIPVVEHEIDEVLGLGSSLNQPFQTTDPSVEDLFRYASNGTRSYTTTPSALAFFSINKTTDLAQFDNQNDGGDWADWQSNPRPGGVNPQVQDAFATIGANPALGVEITALEAIGYDLAAPEPSTFVLVGTALLGAGLLRRRLQARNK